MLPEPTRRAVGTFLTAQSESGVAGVAPFEARMPEFRDAVGRFIGASGEEIAILRSTGDGASVIVHGFPWQAGDEVLLPDDEFPANAVPWLALRKRGVNVRFHDSSRERLTPDALRRSLTPRTKVVAVSWVSFHDGYRCDLAGLAQVAHEHRALLAVDVIQGLGAFPLDVRLAGIDIAFGGAQKWLLGLQGVSFLYLRKNLLDTIEVGIPGWRSVANMWDFLNYDQPWIDDVSRFEGGVPNFAGALSMATSIGVLANGGCDEIAAHVLLLTDRLVDGLQRIGGEILTQRGPAISSGIVTFKIPGVDSVELGRAIQNEEKIVTTWRDSGIRVAPHGYNTVDEIDALLEAVSTRSLSRTTGP